MPYFNYQANNIFQYLPYDTFKRFLELTRRKYIHDCIAKSVAKGLRENGLWTAQEVTFEYNGKRARFDIVAGKTPGVPTMVVEIKTVLDYERQVDDLLLRNQLSVSEAVARGDAVPYGDNAKNAGFQVGQTIGRSMDFTLMSWNVRPDCGLGG